ncbi:uncharacterized protein LOC102804001 [Saccoglossus kowalevskii]|uniref:Uncharacterized protein LOC102804001 n=1 Tax=Saccoglossus kowalevskii TaxID=10224 RepID=A0ABM0M537_SACKO|nr:PREDICTED: uncharacterized protein LOC102804001 [Saccoglossus kowalevskii]
MATSTPNPVHPSNVVDGETTKGQAPLYQHYTNAGDHVYDNSHTGECVKQPLGTDVHHQTQPDMYPQGLYYSEQAPPAYSYQSVNVQLPNIPVTQQVTLIQTEDTGTGSYSGDICALFYAILSFFFCFLLGIYAIAFAIAAISTRGRSGRVADQYCKVSAALASVAAIICFILIVFLLIILL